MPPRAARSTAALGERQRHACSSPTWQICWNGTTRLPTWLIKDLIPEGLTFVVGSPKSSKTYLAYSLALSLADEHAAARPWLGHYDDQQSGTSGLYHLEDDEAESWRRVMALAPGLKACLGTVYLSSWHGLSDLGA